MKKTMLGLMALAGLSLLVGILSNASILPYQFMGVRNHTYLDLAQLFLVAAVAVKICLGDCCKKD